MLTQEQINDLCQAHCYRVIDAMDADSLFSYAVQMMMTSFDQHPGQGDTDLDMLMTDIYTAEDEDEDSVYEFLVGAGVSQDDAHILVNQTEV